MTRFKVLVPLDGSEVSRQALKAVCRLLDPERYRITLLRVAPAPVSKTPQPPAIVTSEWPDPSEAYSRQQDQELARHPIFSSQEWESARAQLKAEMFDDFCRVQKAGFEVAEVVRFGRPGHEIVDLASTEGFDLVVMATHGRGGLNRLLMGSVAEHVVKGLHLPVMLIHPERHLEDEPAQVLGADGTPVNG